MRIRAFSDPSSVARSAIPGFSSGFCVLARQGVVFPYRPVVVTQHEYKATVTSLSSSLIVFAGTVTVTDEKMVCETWREGESRIAFRCVHVLVGIVRKKVAILRNARENKELIAPNNRV